MNIKLSSALLLTVFLIIATIVVIYMFMRAPKKNTNDLYKSLGDQGINQTMTGKDYVYHKQRAADASQYDMIGNTINYGKSDLVYPPSLLARRRIMAEQRF